MTETPTQARQATDPVLGEELCAILDIQLDDQRSAWNRTPDGEYVQRRDAHGYVRPPISDQTFVPEEY